MPVELGGKVFLEETRGGQKRVRCYATALRVNRPTRCKLHPLSQFKCREIMVQKWQVSTSNAPR
jgi:hypothetical protein